MILGTSTSDSVLSWYSTALDQSCHIWCCISPEVDWRSFTTNEGELGQDLPDVAAGHTNVLAHSSDAKKACHHLAEQNKFVGT